MARSQNHLWRMGRPNARGELPPAPPPPVIPFEEAPETDENEDENAGS